MPSWNELLHHLNTLVPQERAPWVETKLQAALQTIATLREDRNVIFYGSAWLQKPQVPASFLQITHEEINGFMSVMYGMDWNKGLVLLLHTPGGYTNAVEPIVEYLYQKFDDIEVIVPTYAMSAGTMISLAANRIIMGRQSQLGPIDPQFPYGARSYSARSIVDQFGQAKSEILTDVKLAHAWAPVLQSLGPALLQEAENALAYGERMVASFLRRRMFAAKGNAEELSNQTAKFFNDAGTHKSHGRRIDRNEARSQDVEVIDLEDNQDVQEAVLTAYHLVTLTFEHTVAVKLLASNHGRRWYKHFQSKA